MRNLLTLLALLFSTILAAQCGTAVLSETICNDNDEWYAIVDVTNDPAGPLIWQGPAGDLTLATEGSWTLGPFNLIDQVVELSFITGTNADCVFIISADQPNDCGTDPCLDFTADLLFVGSAECGSELPGIVVFGGVAPYSLSILNNVGTEVLGDVFNGDDAFYFGYIPGGDYTLVAMDESGCVQTISFNVSSNADCGSISGRSWSDTNGNGIRDTDENTPLLMPVNLLRNDQVIYTTSMTVDGFYNFDNVGEGTYSISFQRPDNTEPTIYQAGDDPTVDSDVTANVITDEIFVSGGANVINIDAGWTTLNCSVSFDVGLAACGDSNDGSITAIANGEAPFTYVWSNGETSASIDDLFPGVYFITITDNTGCTAEGSVDLVAPVGLEAFFSAANNLCGTGPEVVSATILGGVAPFAYLWEVNGVIVSTGQELVNPVYGQPYILTVTDANGCELVLPWSIVGGNQELGRVANLALPCAGGTVTVDLSEVIEDFAFVADYTFQWTSPSGQTSSGLILTTSETGTYTFIGTPPDDACLAVGEVQINAPVCLEDAFIDVRFGEDCSDNLQVFLGGIPNGPSWARWQAPNGDRLFGSPADGLRLINYGYGLYVVGVFTATDSVILSRFVENPNSCVSISGTLYIDANANCSADAGEMPAPGVLVELEEVATGNVTYVFTDGAGQYDADVDAGQYIVQPWLEPVAGLPFGTCDPPVTVTAVGGTAVTADIFLPVLADCPLMTVDVAVPFFRRCFQSNFFVDYENRGSTTAENATLTVEVDAFLLNATPVFDGAFTQSENTFTFQLGDLPPFFRGNIPFTVEVSCDAELGQAHCITASVTPADICFDPAGWNGALVNVGEVECNGGNARFEIVNVGDNPMSVPLRYVIVEDGIMMTPVPIIVPPLEIGQVFPVDVPADGGTYQIITNQEPNAPVNNDPSAVIEGCNAGVRSLGFVNAGILGNGLSSEVTVCRENIGAFDPNDKTGYPTGYGADNDIEVDTRLTYAIRFQNTGTDTAFNVVIRDTISTLLDLTTFKAEAASHDYRVSIDSQRVVTFTFQNIMLPDSNVNLAASQGVVNFSIDPVIGIERGSFLNNNAGIYFDFNAPIITNLTSHRIALNPIISGVREQLARSVPVGVYPNPAGDRIRVDLPTNAVTPQTMLTIIDLYGRTLQQASYATAANGWDVTTLPSGYYLVVATDAAGRAIGRTGLVVAR